MERFQIIAFEKENGKIPVEEFINSLDFNMKAKIYGLLDVLQDAGYMLREPYSKHLEDGIFELRCRFANDVTRILYFFYHEKNIILTNGFVKKTQKTPKKQIKLAKARRKEYIDRRKNDANT